VAHLIQDVSTLSQEYHNDTEMTHHPLMARDLIPLNHPPFTEHQPLYNLLHCTFCPVLSFDAGEKF
jgi:hypothetical protein